jgi:hypothetical protein
MEAIILLVAFHCCFLTTVSAQGTPVTLSELMITPAVRKDKGTWFEFYNPGDQSYDLTNRFLALGNYNVSSSTFGISGLQIERFKIPSGLVIRPKQYFVMGNNDDRATNGDYAVDWKYGPHFEMNETFGIVALIEVNKANESAVSVVGIWGYPGYPAPSLLMGASLSAKNVTLPFNGFNEETWCVSHGTPNATNICGITKPPTMTPTKPPSKSPTKPPTISPTKRPTKAPTKRPTKTPTRRPTMTPTKTPTRLPTKAPTASTTRRPTRHPTKTPSLKPAPPKVPSGAPVRAGSKTCGLFGLRVFCPCSKCGIAGRFFGWCKK